MVKTETRIGLSQQMKIKAASFMFNTADVACKFTVYL